MNPTVITSVRVLIDRAAVTRRAEFRGSSVEVSPLPIDAETSAMDVRATASDGRPIQALSISLRPIERDPSARRTEIDRQLRSIENKLAELRAEKTAEDARSRRLDEYAQIATDALSFEWLERDTGFEGWEKTLDAMREGRAQQATRSATIATLTNDLLREKAGLLEEKSKAGESERIGLSALVELEANEDDSGFVEVETHTRQTQWMPSYDARIDEAAGTVELELSALVKNATGESWRQITLTATTARPNLTAPLEELQRSVLHATRKARPRLTASDRVDKRPRGGAAADTTEISYDSPGLVDIPESGEAVRVALFTIILPLSTRLVLSPGVSAVASRVAELVNSSDKILLPGPVSVFRKGAYAGSTDIGFALPGQRLIIPIAHDASLRVFRHSHQEDSRSKISLGSSRVESFTTTVEIENPSPDPIAFVLRDRVPVSKTDDVVVEITERPEHLHIDPESGFTQLHLDLAGREKRSVRLSYRLHIRGERSLPRPDRL